MYSGPLSARQGSWRADNGRLYIYKDADTPSYVEYQEKLIWGWQKLVLIAEWSYFQVVNSGNLLYI